MHDPLCVAFTIPRPWPNRSRLTGRRYWPELVTVWHREPGGNDSGTVCRHYDRATGRVLNGWRWHVWHWRVQLHPLQALRRRLLTRCTWCDGRSRKGDPVNHSHSWDGPRGRWWRGEPGLYHSDCSAYVSAHATCTCETPVLDGGSYGRCAVCGKYRAFGMTPGRVGIARILAAVPPGQRNPRAMRTVADLANIERLLEEHRERAGG